LNYSRRQYSAWLTSAAADAAVGNPHLGPLLLQQQQLLLLLPLPSVCQTVVEKTLGWG
jgi:hypothetical protein